MQRTLEYLTGISDAECRRLRACGIRHSNHLLHRASLQIDRERLSERTNISQGRLLQFARECSLLEVSGVERYLPVLRKLGITSMNDLKQQNPEELHQSIVDAVGYSGTPRLTDVQYWVSQSKNCDVVEELEPAPIPPMVR